MVELYQGFILNDVILGHVGPPLPCSKVKLVDVPEMDYFAKDQKGEVSLCIVYCFEDRCPAL